MLIQNMSRVWVSHEGAECISNKKQGVPKKLPLLFLQYLWFLCTEKNGDLTIFHHKNQK